jgi:hypothetical protein
LTGQIADAGLVEGLTEIPSDEVAPFNQAQLSASLNVDRNINGSKLQNADLEFLNLIKRIESFYLPAFRICRLNLRQLRRGRTT